MSISMGQSILVSILPLLNLVLIIGVVVLLVIVLLKLNTALTIWIEQNRRK